MEDVDDQSVHLVVTSPPYWQLKDYGSDEQIGFNDTYEDYINHLNLVWDQCFRVLHPGCRLCINIGDQFARSVYYGRYKIIPIRTEIIKFCETKGFDYMGAIIWQKVTTTNTSGGGTIMGSFPFPRNGILKLDYEFILIFKKIGSPPKVDPEVKKISKLTLQEWNEYFSGHWNFPGERQSKHLAMYPLELPSRLIKMFSFYGDTILDPFLGSGTSSLAARSLQRNSLGYEVNLDFLSVIIEKMGIGQADVFNNAETEILKKPQTIRDFKDRINGLCYIFKDPIKQDKKLDVKKLNFGSKIDQNSTNGNSKLHKVTKVLSPSILEIDNSIIVKLIGVLENKIRKNDAIDFLTNKTKKQKVYMEFDNLKYDENGYLLCYMYLKNRTHLNAHLIKQGLVDVDTEMSYKNKKRYLSYKRE